MWKRAKPWWRKMTFSCWFPSQVFLGDFFFILHKATLAISILIWCLFKFPLCSSLVGRVIFMSWMHVNVTTKLLQVTLQVGKFLTLIKLWVYVLWSCYWENITDTIDAASVLMVKFVEIKYNIFFKFFFLCVTLWITLSILYSQGYPNSVLEGRCPAECSSSAEVVMHRVY